MESVKHRITALIQQSLAGQTGFSSAQLHLSIPDEQFGDFATNIALISAKAASANPRELAQQFQQVLMADPQITKYIRSVDVAGPGFLNLTLHDSVYIDELKKISDTNTHYGHSEFFSGKRAVIDYSAPNIAKRFSIGHLRSTIIGQAIYNVLESQGYESVGVNHLGDWGTQFGKLIVALRKWNAKPVEQLSFKELEKLYVRFHQEADDNESLVIEARQAFKNLEDGNDEERQLWLTLIQISLAEFDKIYRLLGVRIDHAIGESFYLDRLQGVLDDAAQKGLIEESQGAKIIRFANDSMPPGLLIKSDGASTYFLRDLATIKYRKERWQPNLFVYEVGSEQKLHFEQVFEAAAMLGYGNREDFHHIAHGQITTTEGRMSTRKGNTIKLYDVLKRVIAKAEDVSADKKIARKVGVGALKYNDLKRSPSSNYVFDWDEVLNLDGNTGPYLQYTYARTSSIMAKAGSTAIEYDTDSYDFNVDELRVVRTLSRFPDVLFEASQSLTPSVVCHYLYSLSQAYNSFYNNNSVLNADSQEQRKLRLHLTVATRQILQNGMKLLGIPVLNRM